MALGASGLWVRGLGCPCPLPGTRGHSPEPDSAHEGGFGEDSVLWGAVPRDWLGLVASPHDSQRGLAASPARFSGFTSWFPARAVSLSIPPSSSSPLLPTPSPEQGIALAPPAAVPFVHCPVLGAAGRGSLSPAPLGARRCSEELPPCFQGRSRSPSLAAFPWRPPFPSRSGSAATGAARGVRRGPGGHRARPGAGPELGRLPAVPLRGADPLGASLGSTAGSLGSASIWSHPP